MDFGKAWRVRGSVPGSGSSRMDEEFRRFGFLVYRVALGILKSREEAEDLVLDVFAHKVGAFLEGHPDIAPAELGYWLHRVAKNLALDRLRSRRRAPAVLDIEALAAAANEEEAEPAADWMRLLSALDHTDRRILQGKYGQGLTWEDVCRQAGLTMAQTRYRAEKALAKLRKLATKEAGHAL